MEFQYSCVGCPNVEELDYLLEQKEMISLEQFRKAIEEEAYRELEQSLGYSGGFLLEEDKYVEYYESSLPDGRPVVFACHSAIEYVYY